MAEKNNRENIVIRPATTQDASQFLDLYIRSYKNLCANHYSQENLNALLNVYNKIEETYGTEKESYFVGWMNAGEHTFVAEDTSTKKIIGISKYYDWANYGNEEIAKRGVTITATAVDPNYTGRNIGTDLLKCVEKHARENGVKKLSLESTLNAVPFYKKNGYIMGKKHTNTDNDLTIEVVDMSKNLLERSLDEKESSHTYRLSTAPRPNHHR